MKKIAISSRKKQNKSRKIVYTEPSLKGNIVSNGKRANKNRDFRLRTALNTLWRSVSYSVVLQKTPSEKYFATSDLLILNQRQRLSNRRENISRENSE